MPYEGRRGAYWALLGPDIEFRRTEYDVEATVAAIQVMRCSGRRETPRVPPRAAGSDATTEYFESLRAA